MWINNSIKSSYSIERSRFDRLEDTYEQLLTRLSSLSAVRADLPTPLDRACLYFLRGTVHRARSLFDGLATTLKAKNALPGFLLVRAHFETTGAVAYFLRELTKFKNNEYDNQQLYHSVRAMTLGMREISKAFPAPERVPRIPSVLTYIDEVDKFIKRNSSTKMPLFRTDYEFLSEFCHPNAFAFILSGRGDSLRKGRSGPSNTLTPKDLHTLLVFQFHTSYHFIVLYDQVWELIKERFTSS